MTWFSRLRHLKRLFFFCQRRELPPRVEGQRVDGKNVVGAADSISVVSKVKENGKES